MDFLLNLHSVLRYLILALLLLTITVSIIALKKNKSFSKQHDLLSLFLFISAHSQLLLGILLYFSSAIVQIGLQNIGIAMKSKLLRFWTVEHAVIMVLAIVLISLGRITAKKAKTDKLKFKKLLIYNTIALLLILAAIPWFFREEIARGW